MENEPNPRPSSPSNSKTQFVKAILSASLLLNVILVIAVCAIIVSYSSSGSKVTSAVCHVKPNPSEKLANATRNANPIEGTVKLESHGGNLEINLQLTGFQSGSGSKKHGFHVHQFGDIVTDGCQSTGGHFNPEQVKHGNISDSTRHVGDWGNILVAPNGSLSTTFHDNVASLKGKYGILGRAIVIHQLEDDLGRGGNEGSEKTGNAGARLACCVISPVD